MAGKNTALTPPDRGSNPRGAKPNQGLNPNGGPNLNEGLNPNRESSLIAESNLNRESKLSEALNITAGPNASSGLKLTTTAIKNAAPAAKPYRISAGRGLSLLIHPNGSKYWQYRFRRLGEEQIISIGVWGTTKDFVSLEDAFAAREEIRKKIRSGIDPAEERRALKGSEREARKIAQENAKKMAQEMAEENGEESAPAGPSSKPRPRPASKSRPGSFERVALDWLTVWSRGKKARTVSYQERRLQNDIFPLIGAIPVEQVGRKDVIQVVKHIDARGAHEMASRALNAISRILGYAVTHELRDSNPAFDIKPADLIGAVTAKNFASIPPQELPALLKKINAYQGLITRCAMQILALTFVRSSELIEAQWSEIDFAAKRWTIPGARMKKTKGGPVPHIVPLATQTFAVLQTLRKISGSGKWLFPGSAGEKPISNNTVLNALDRMGYKGRMTGHGFRSIASTVLHEQGFNHLHIERQLSHMERDEVAAAYNFAQYLAQRAVMMQWWADYLTEAAGGVRE